MSAPTEQPSPLARLRALPEEVSIEQMAQLVAAFPLTPTPSSWLASIKSNLNLLLMTTLGTFLLGIAYVAFRSGSPVPVDIQPPSAPAPITVERAAPVPAPHVEPLAATPQPAAPRKQVVPVAAPPTDEPAAPAPSEPTPTEGPAPVVPDYMAASGGSGASANNAPRNNGNSELRDFRSISLECSADVMVEQGPFQVAITGEGELMDRIRVRVEGGTLQVYVEGINTFSKCESRGKVTVQVRMPAMDELLVRGSGSIRAGAFDRADDLRLQLKGSGDIDLAGIKQVRNLRLQLDGSGDIVCRSVNVAGTTTLLLNGSGDIEATGTTDRVEVDLKGSGDINTSGLKSQGGRVTLVGSGDARVHSDGPLQLKVAGSGTIHTTGKGGHVKRDIFDEVQRKI